MDKGLSLGIVIGATLSSSVGSAFSTLEKKLFKTKNIAEKIGFGKELAEKIKARSRDVKILGRAIERAERPSAELKKKFFQAKRELAELKLEGKKFGITLKSATKDAKRLEGALKAIEAKEKSLQAAMSRREYRDQIKGQIFDTIALGAAIGAPIKAAIDFESTMADVKKVVDFPTPKAFKEMQKQILDLSTALPMSAQGIGEIIAAAGQAGIARKELLEFAKDAAEMGIAFDMSAKEAGDVMAGLRSIFHLNQKQVVLLGDAYNHLSNNMNATARDILNVAKRTGSMGKLLGLTGQQIGALAATFLDLKTPPEIASTAINALLLKLGTADKQGGKFQQALQRIGFSAEEMKQMIKEDAQGAILKFLEAVKGSDDVMGTLSDLFGAEYSDDIAKLVGGLDKYKKALSLVAKQENYIGSMHKEYSARAKTTANNLQLLKNQMTKLAVNIGSALLPGLNAIIMPIGKVINGIADLAQKFPFLTKVIGGAMVGFIGLKVVTMGIGYGFSLLADGAGVAYRAILSLRPSVLATNIAMLRSKIASEAVALAEKRQAAMSFLLAAKNKILALSQKQVGVGAMWTAIKMRALSVAQKAWAVGSTIVTGATTAIGTAFRAMSAAIMSNPIGLIIGGIALAAGLVIAYWKPIKAFFGKLWEGVKTAFAGAWSFIKRILNGFKTAFLNFTPAGWLIKIRDFLSNFNLFESGKKIILTLVSGVKSVVMAPFNAVKAVFKKIRNLLPFSDAKEGPLSQLTKSGRAIAETLAVGLKGTNVLEGAMHRRLQGLKKATMVAGLSIPLMMQSPAPAIPSVEDLAARAVYKTELLRPRAEDIFSKAMHKPLLPSVSLKDARAKAIYRPEMQRVMPQDVFGRAIYKSEIMKPGLKDVFAKALYRPVLPEVSPEDLAARAVYKTERTRKPLNAEYKTFKKEPPVINIVVHQKIEVHGNKVDSERIKEAATLSEEKLRKTIERIIANEKRLSYV